MPQKVLPTTVRAREFAARRGLAKAVDELVRSRIARAGCRELDNDTAVDNLALRLDDVLSQYREST